jgi:hypothetical protein
MKASESLQNDQSTATEEGLRQAVDTTPAFIHTARPDVREAADYLIFTVCIVATKGVFV